MLWDREISLHLFYACIWLSFFIQFNQIISLLVVHESPSPEILGNKLNVYQPPLNPREKSIVCLPKHDKNIYHRIPRNSHCEVLVINDYKWINIQKLIDINTLI